MSSQLLCIDGKFNADFLAFYNLFGIKTPEEGRIYTPRAISRNSNGDWEILLNEIVNRTVLIKHPILQTTAKEPAWKISRFTNLDGNPVSKEKIKESIKEEI